MIRDLVTIVAAFVFASAVAEALGAVNLGTALAFGQMAVAATVVLLDAAALRRPRPACNEPART